MRWSVKRLSLEQVMKVPGLVSKHSTLPYKELISTSWLCLYPYNNTSALMSHLLQISRCRQPSGNFKLNSLLYNLQERIILVLLSMSKDISCSLHCPVFTRLFLLNLSLLLWPGFELIISISQIYEPCKQLSGLLVIYLLVAGQKCLPESDLLKY